MINFLRSFFGIGDASGNRKVVGGSVSVDVKDVQYIKESNNRINELHNLYNRYKGTPHEHKLKEVYEKTKNVHTYLVSKGRVHELELFHLQNTDHFINTFTIILDVHQKHAAAPTTATAATEPAEDSFFKHFKASATGKAKAVVAGINPKVHRHTESTLADVPVAGIPEVAIDTSSCIQYLSNDATGPIQRQIGFTSIKEEKDAFVAHVAARLGVYKLDVSYVGNAMLTLPASNGITLSEYVPVLHWRSVMYALSLNDYRLFPVRLYRRSR